ncbi:MAG TPA: SWIM zinc finger family protein [Anaerolineae bacterium]|nr:SWIM zinc finger family protein [Anaerolineae bacterium]HQK14596.1 SWIM zinc finger family protein [Anaerolineae bacterium]
MAKRRSRSYYDDYWPHYEPTHPIEVDGIKAKSQYGKFVQSWWADKWINALTRLMDAGRLGRGRSYARKGQVLEINIKAGKVAARVQGSRPSPYKVSIELKPLSDEQWAKVLDTLAEQAIFAAQLLNEEMPNDIEQVFDKAKVPLFPQSSRDLITNCSCPDWANPCKHVAAVYYLLGERFDEDPFLLFELRGRSKAEIIAALRERRTAGASMPEPMAYVPDAIAAVDAPPLPDCLDTYWGTPAAWENVSLHIAIPSVEMALLKRLGLPDFADPATFRAQMERLYGGVTEHAMDIAFREVSNTAMD